MIFVGIFSRSKIDTSLEFAPPTELADRLFFAIEMTKNVFAFLDVPDIVIDEEEVRFTQIYFIIYFTSYFRPYFNFTLKL